MSTDSLSSLRSAAGFISEPLGGVEHEEGKATPLPEPTKPTEVAIQSSDFGQRQRMIQEEFAPNPLMSTLSGRAPNEQKSAVSEDCGSYSISNKQSHSNTVSPTGITPALDPMSHCVFIASFAVSLWPSSLPTLGLDKIYVLAKGNSTNSSTALVKTKPTAPVSVGDMVCVSWNGPGWILPLPLADSDSSTLQLEIKISRSFLPDKSLGKATIDLSAIAGTRTAQCRAEFEGGFFMVTLRVCPRFIPFDLVAGFPSFMLEAPPPRWYERLFPCLPFLKPQGRKPRAQKTGEGKVSGRLPQHSAISVLSLDSPMCSEWKQERP